MIRGLCIGTRALILLWDHVVRIRLKISSCWPHVEPLKGLLALHDGGWISANIYYVLLFDNIFKVALYFHTISYILVSGGRTCRLRRIITILLGFLIQLLIRKAISLVPVLLLKNLSHALKIHCESVVAESTHITFLLFYFQKLWYTCKHF